VNLKPSAVLTTATLAVAVVLSSCTDAALEKPAAAATNLGNQLTLTGRVCTQPPNPGGFPVKVLFLVDQSGSMCISDPPGSQGVAGLCEELVTLGIVPANLTTPARVRAIESLLAQFQDEITNQGANITVSIVPFATNVQNPYPAEGTTPSFVTPFGLTGYLSALQGQLGKGTDDQGALSYAYTVIAGDVAATAATPRSCPARGTSSSGSPMGRRTRAARPSTTCPSMRTRSTRTSSGPTRSRTTATRPALPEATPSTASSWAPTATRTTRFSATSTKS